MAESSLRALRPPRRGGLPNALFVAAAAERPPAELLGTAAELTITFPWGSLIRGALALDEAAEAADGIAGLLAPGGTARFLLSIDPRDRLDLPALDQGTEGELRRRWRRHGLELTSWRPATEEDIAASGSSWARRLRAGQARAAWRLDLRRPTIADTADPRVRPRSDTVGG